MRRNVSFYIDVGQSSDIITFVGGLTLCLIAIGIGGTLIKNIIYL